MSTQTPLPASCLSLQAVLLSVLGPVALAGTLFAALITHTFVDAVPSTFLGIPEADTSLAVLPAHALCLEGNGEEAVRIAALGSACAMVIAVPVSVLCFLLLPALQPYFDWWIGILLVASVGYMIVTSEAPGWALAIFAVSGALGAFALHYTFLSWHMLAGGSAILMPLLTGLFGISVLLVASQGTLPVQHFSGLRIENKAVIKYSLLGTGAGIAVGWLPGLSTASANGVLASVIGYEKDRRSYILATNAANTANAFIGLAALFALSRMRNGVMAALAETPAAVHGRADGHRRARCLCSICHHDPSFRICPSPQRVRQQGPEPDGHGLCRPAQHRPHRAPSAFLSCCSQPQSVLSPISSMSRECTAWVRSWSR